ncbi:unnamed protein product [Didymodactylos carnosus]|nr:unnamed protein product [Didymodactylos carnosus]CAF4074430.1 unnamed protein product [Didymodactylos carnosus]
MDNMYRYSRESGLNGLFPYSLVFSHYETLKEIHHELFLLCLLWFHLLLIFTLILFLSIRLTLTITFHYICLLSTLFTCLYLFHSLTINFANTFLLFIIPGIFIDCFIHYAYTYQRKINGENIKTYQCLFGYDRIFLSLLLSLIALIFFQIQSYTFIVLRNTLFYYILLAFLHLNIFFPLWLNLCKSSTNKGVSTTTTQTNQIPITSIDSNGNGVEQTLLTTSNGTLDNSHSYHKNGFIMNEPQKSS